MAYGDNRTLVASDTFDTSIDGNWDNGYADWNAATAQAGGTVGPAATASNVGLRRNTGTYTADQYSRVTAGSTGASKEVGAACRMHPSSTTDESCYLGAVSDFGTDLYIIYECSAGAGSVTFSTLTSASWSGAPTATTDIFTLEAEGTTLRMGSSEGAGDAQRLTTTDATLDGATYSTVGFYMYAESNIANARVTAWDGGSIGAAAAAYNAVPVLEYYLTRRQTGVFH